MADNIQMVTQGTSFYDAGTMADETVTVTITNATGGTFTLTFGGQTTTAIAYNATAAAVQAALVLLSSIGTGNVQVSGAAGGPYTVRFVNALAHTNVGAVTFTDSTTGAGHTITVTVVTQGFNGVNLSWGTGAGAVHEVVYAPAASRSAKLINAINSGLVEETANSVTADPTPAATTRRSVYVQATDPGAVGAGQLWSDTSGNPPVLKIRNTANGAWLTV